MIEHPQPPDVECRRADFRVCPRQWNPVGCGTRPCHRFEVEETPTTRRVWETHWTYDPPAPRV